MALTDATIRNAKPDERAYKLADGGGLYLLVNPNGSRLWRLKYRFAGSEKLLALGAYPAVTLAKARTKRDEAKGLLADGIDPNEAKKEIQREIVAESVNTFGTIADEWVAKLTREGRAERTLQKTGWLLTFARPKLGTRPIRQITAAEILEVLRTVEIRGRHESARRLRSTIGGVFRYAIATARAENDPTIALQGALTRPTVNHRAAITDPVAFGALLRALDGFEGQPVTHAALKLAALLFPRPGELRAAEWSEFDFAKATWTILASRAKMRRTHTIPLPRQALAILEDLRRITGNSVLAFPCVRSVLRPISENTLNAALRRLGYSKEEATAHGFRATASTLLNECGKWNPDAIERQLAHVEGNDVRRAYARGEHWDERVEMMQWWADHLDTLRIGGEVVEFSARRTTP